MPQHPRAGEATPARTASNSTMFGARRITVPSGGHFYGSGFRAMSPGGAHIFVQSSSDLTQPVDGVIGQGGGHFDLVGGHVRRVDCQCTGIRGSSSDASAIVAEAIAKLTPSDPDTSTDLYLLDAAGPRLISPGVNGTPKYAGMTSDASFVFFTTDLSLAPGDTNIDRDLYRWSRATGAVQLVSVPGYNPVILAMSGDGSRVLYSQGTTGPPGNPGSMRLWTGTATVSIGYGTYIASDSGLTRIAFNTDRALDAVDVDTATDGYRYDASGFHDLTEPSASFAGIAAMSSTWDAWIVDALDPLTGDDHDASADLFLADGSSLQLISHGDRDITAVQASANLDTVVYETDAKLDPADTNDFADVYRWTAADPTQATLISGATQGGAHIVAESPDGSRTLITSYSAILPEDTDPYADLYEWVDGSLDLVFPGAIDYRIEAWTPDLLRVVASSAGPLTGEDTNGGVFDVYISDADLTPPTISIDGPAAPTGPIVDIPFDSTNHEAVWFECAVDAADRAPCASPLHLGPLPPGSHSLSVRGFDPAGNVDTDTVTWTVTPDVVPPIATAPTCSLSIGTALAGGQVPVRIAWTGTDESSGIDHYELSLRTDGGSWSGPTIVAVTSVTRLLYGHAYAFRVQAFDRSGNAGDIVPGPSCRIIGVSQAYPAVHYHGTWATSTSTTWWGGTAKSSSKAGSTVSYTFTGRSIAWVGLKAFNRGKANVYVNGVLKATVDLRSTTTQKQVLVWSANYSTSATRTVTIKVLGTSGRPRVDVDGFIVGS